MGRYLLFALIVAVPSAAAQQPPSTDEQGNRIRLEVVGCVDGSTLTETNLNHTSKGRDTLNSAGQWHLSASREVLQQIRNESRRELRIVGLVDRKDARGTVVTERRLGGRVRVYAGRTDRPLTARVVPPTLRVESFVPTSNGC